MGYWQPDHRQQNLVAPVQFKGVSGAHSPLSLLATLAGSVMGCLQARQHVTEQRVELGGAQSGHGEEDALVAAQVLVAKDHGSYSLPTQQPY